MAKKMRYCFWCGEKIGICESWDDFDTCGKPECDMAARRAHQEDTEDRAYRAQRDEFSRYR